MGGGISQDNNDIVWSYLFDIKNINNVNCRSCDRYGMSCHGNIIQIFLELKTTGSVLNF